MEEKKPFYKKLRFVVLVISFVALVLLGACDGASKDYKRQLKESKKNLEETKRETERLEEISEQIDETTKMLDELHEELEKENDNVIELDELKEVLEYEGIGTDDKIIDLKLEEDELIVKVELSDGNIIKDKTVLAESRYSTIGEALLKYKGWELLTVDFINIGTITLHRSKEETNEHGVSYFPLEKIIGQLH